MAASLIWTAVFAFSSYLFARCVYRAYIHPLARFPGPKLASLTYLYEFYYDGVKQGQYTSKIRRLHDKYGPIIRINPDELHVNDPAFIDLLYAGGGKKRDKFGYFTAQFGLPDSAFTTTSHSRHRLLRGALNRFFSRAAVTKLESSISSLSRKLCDTLEANAGTGQPVELGNAYSCLTTDIVTSYAYGKSADLLTSSTFQPNLRRAILAGCAMGPTIKQWPWIYTLLQSLPDSTVSSLMPDMAIYLAFQQSMRDQVNEIKVGNDTTYEKRPGGTATIFHELLDSDLPESDKGTERLWQEGQTIVGAGTETTAWTLAVLTFHLLDNPEKLQKLQSELKGIVRDMDDLPSWSVLEQLPYINATVHEGLRLSYGVGTRLARIATEPLVFSSVLKTGQNVEWVIPPGTPVGMSSVLIHQNQDIFPKPLEFLPERWLDHEGRRVRNLDQFLLSFSKGSRQCLGMNLAYAELYITLASIVLRLIDRMELYQTLVADVEFDHECFVPIPKHGTQGVRVLIREA